MVVFVHNTFYFECCCIIQGIRCEFIVLVNLETFKSIPNFPPLNKKPGNKAVGEKRSPYIKGFPFSEIVLCSALWPYIFPGQNEKNANKYVKAKLRRKGGKAKPAWRLRGRTYNCTSFWPVFWIPKNGTKKELFCES